MVLVKWVTILVEIEKKNRIFLEIERKVIELMIKLSRERGLPMLSSNHGNFFRLCERKSD